MLNHVVSVVSTIPFLPMRVPFLQLRCVHHSGGARILAARAAAQQLQTSYRNVPVATKAAQQFLNMTGFP